MREYDASEFDVDHLGCAGVRVTHRETGEWRECTKHVVLSMNYDAAMSELVMELQTRPD